MKTSSLSLAAIICAVFLTGCSFITTSPETTTESKPLKGYAEPVDHWRARGKFSYRSPETSESGNFDWRQQGQNYQLRLYGPLGMGSIRISGNPNLVRIQTGDQDISSDQPLSLLYRMTGFEIPLNSMTMWLAGRPASQSPLNIRLDDEERIESFFERKWRLNYSAYKEFETQTLSQQIPTTIKAQKDDINLRMIINTWKDERE